MQMHLYRLQFGFDSTFVLAPDVLTALAVAEVGDLDYLRGIVEYPLDQAYRLPADWQDHPVDVTPIPKPTELPGA